MYLNKVTFDWGGREGGRESVTFVLAGFFAGQLHNSPTFSCSLCPAKFAGKID